MGAICDKHELSNCAECTGTAAAYEETLREPTHWQRQQLRGDLPPLPHIPDGPTIYSQFPGNCAGCGRRYDRDQGIHYSADHDGWIGIDCCAEVPGR